MPAYTLPPTVGSWATNTDSSALSVTAPASSAGKLLVLVTGNRSGGVSVASITGWTQIGSIATNGSIEVWARVGDGTGTDSPSVDWSGTNDSAAVILSYSGDVYSDISTIVAHSATVDFSAATTAPLPAVSGVTTDNCLVLAVGRHNKTATTNGATLTHSTLNIRAQNTGTNVDQIIGVADLQQTTATNYDGTDFTISNTGDNLASNGIVLFLKTSAAALPKYVKLLADSSAASAIGVEVVVFSAPSGSNYVTGTTRYGSASGKSFEASLESGNAVLKVPAEDVGCDGLAVSTTVAALARNTTYTTGMVEATIIEE